MLRSGHSWCACDPAGPARRWIRLALEETAIDLDSWDALVCAFRAEPELLCAMALEQGPLRYS